jgi:hypothetical protein
METISLTDTENKSLREEGVAVKQFAAGQLFPGFAVRRVFVLPEETGGLAIELGDVASLPPGV